MSSHQADDGGHQQPHYHRYNHFPQRSSYSYSSSNLSSYTKSNHGLPPSTSSLRIPHKSPLLSSSSMPSTVTSSSSSPSSNSSSSPQQSASSLSHYPEDDFSVIEESSTSAISLYEVFATGVSPKRRLQQNNSELDNKRSDSLSPLPCGANSVTSSLCRNNNEDNIMISSARYFSTNNASAERQNDDDNESVENSNDNDGTIDSNNDVRDLSSSLQQQQLIGDDNNNEKDNPPVQNPQQHDDDDDVFTKYRKRLVALMVSMAALWIYTQLRRSKRRHGQRRQLKDSTRHNANIVTVIFDHAKARNVMQYVLRLISIPVSSIIRRLTQNQANARILTNSTTQEVLTSVSPTSWENAIATPLSHLLALAESGTISKVLVRGSILTYLHSIPSSPSSPNPNGNSSKEQQQQRWSKTTLPSQNPTIINQIISTLLQKGCHDIETMPESLWSRFWNGPAIVALPFAYLAGLYWIMRRLQRQQLEDDNNNDGTTTTSTNTATTFEDVKGINSSLQELSEVVSFLRHPNDFHSIGAAPPRGILLHGPPGTGKTLLARAIAGELTRRDSSSPPTNKSTSSMGQNSIDAFTVCSGSDFVETYVGRGAARVRAMFRKVREDALANFQRRQKERVIMERTLRRLHTDVGISSPEQPNRNVLSRAVSDLGVRIVGAWDELHAFVNPGACSSADDDIQDTPLAIIFIDEIDALAKQRDSGTGFSSLGGNDEREQTLNQLLTEMDGFKTGGPTDNVTVIVIAATNRPHVLDSAILRSGRFDRHVAVHLPDCQGREDILRLHARRIRWDSSTVNFRNIAEMTPQCSGADLKCLINEAALLAVRSGSKMVLQEHLVLAAQKVKKSSRGGGRHSSGTSLY